MKNSQPHTQSRKSKPDMTYRVLFMLVISIFFFVGFLYIRFTNERSIDETTNNALTEANIIQKSLDVHSLEQFQLNSSDINLPAYQNIKSKLMELVKLDKNTRFIYFLKEKNGKLFFMVDSEPVSSKDYSPPGQEYDNPSDIEVLMPFRDGNTIITKPTKDAWGTWVSVLIPLKNKSGKIIAVMGVDYPEDMWQKEAAVKSFQATVIVVVILLLTFSLFNIFVKNASLRNSIIQRNRIESELIKSKELAEAASIAKSTFLSNMSHEIRTPLNGIIGFTDLLSNTKLDKIQREYLDYTVSSANSLLSIITDVLDLSKIESGKLQLELIMTDLIKVVENATDIIKLQAASKKLELLLNIQPDIPRFAVIDPVRLKQILVNLLSNAIKFTHSGEVELKLVYQEVDNEHGRFSFSVRDTGIGIKEEDRDKLFKSFSQVDASTSRRYGGTGLGLIISNSLALKMGSVIEFESEVGKGSTFFFTLDTKYENAGEQDIATLNNIKSALVIDDNYNNRLILEHTLNHWGIEYTGVEDGLKALDVLNEKEDNFDLIIVDYQMPYLNGIETIKKIREISRYTSGENPIILLHSSADNVVLMEKSKDLKIRFMLTKPIKADELYLYLSNIDKVEGLTNVEEDSSSLAEKPMPVISGKFKIMVAEDTQLNMFLICNMLKYMMPGVVIYQASNGAEAIDLLNDITPDLIFMDVQMPNINGIDATKQIREQLKLTKVPIVALTAGVTKEERQSCFQAGMNDFISKPVDRNSLFGILMKYLILNSDNKKMIEIQDESKELSHFDREGLVEKTGSNSDLINQLLSLSLVEYPKYIDDLGKAISDLNHKDIKSIAHKLKGTSANMGFDILSKLAKEIELNIHDYSKINELLKSVKDEWKIVTAIIKQ